MPGTERGLHEQRVSISNDPLVTGVVQELNTWEQQCSTVIVADHAIHNYKQLEVPRRDEGEYARCPESCALSEYKLVAGYRTVVRMIETVYYCVRQGCKFHPECRRAGAEVTRAAKRLGSPMNDRAACSATSHSPTAGSANSIGRQRC